MTAFFETTTLALTPLSPVHIGCGEDYDPTGYVIRDGFLYAFEASSALLTTAEADDLKRTARTGNLPDIARFFSRHAESFIPGARTAAPVNHFFEQNYESLMKGDERGRGFISRTAYVGFGEEDIPYIPGSALKGAVHTGLMDRVNNGRKVEKASDEIILGGGFDKSPMRLLKISDLMPKAPVPKRVVLARRIHKGDAEEVFSRGGKGTGNVWAGFEALDAGVCRAFEGTASLGRKSDFPTIGYAYTDWAKVAVDLNRRSLALWEREYKQWERIPQATKWLASVRKLLAAVRPDLEAGRMALVRIGKNQGAESLVLGGGIAKIKIMHGKGEKPTYEPTTTTQWVVVEEEVLPFGWCMLELGGFRSAPLEVWCNARTKSSIKDLAGMRAKWRAQKTAALEAERLAEEVRVAKEREEAERLAKLSEESRLVDALETKLTRFPGDVKPGTELYKEVVALLEAALGWSVDEQKNCAARLGPLVKKKGMYQGKAEKELKAKLRQLRNEG